MVSMLASKAVNYGCFYTKHTALRRKRKEWVYNQDTVSQWRTCRLADCNFNDLHFCNTENSTIKWVSRGWREQHHHVIKFIFFLSLNIFHRWKIAHLALNNNHSLIHYFMFSHFCSCNDSDSNYLYIYYFISVANCFAIYIVYHQFHDCCTDILPEN